MRAICGGYATRHYSYADGGRQSPGAGDVARQNPPYHHDCYDGHNGYDGHNVYDIYGYVGGDNVYNVYDIYGYVGADNVYDIGYDGDVGPSS